MTKDELNVMLTELRKIFDLVRMVDVSLTREMIFKEDGSVEGVPYHCYAVWKKDGRCENCISAKAYARKMQLYKFEFVDREVYMVISRYVEVDGVPYMMEMVNRIDNEALFDAYGKNEFISRITGYSKKLYVDSLTGTYNRRYYEEQLQALKNHRAIAMIDVDHFKGVNDTYGHLMGDHVLKKVGREIMRHVKDKDAVIRYGGDEFLISFIDIPEEVFAARLEQIRAAVEAIPFDDVPDLKVTISIGGVYHESQEEVDLIRESDHALYQAKLERNAVEVVKK